MSVKYQVDQKLVSSVSGVCKINFMAVCGPLVSKSHLKCGVNSDRDSCLSNTSMSKER